jgi:anti-sigma B factor antagonist
MNFSVRENGNGEVIVIRTPKRFTVESASAFKDILNDFVKNEKYNFVVDLSATEYMDSSGLGAIVSRIAATRANQGDIRLANPSKSVQDLLDLTQLSRILKIYENVDSGVASFD